MNIRLILSVITLLSVVSHRCYGKLPSGIKICSKNDPNISTCIVDSIRNLQPKLASGNLAPDFRVTPLEPLKLENIHIDRGPVFQVDITNLYVTKGASKFQIDKMRVNLDVPAFDFLISIPKLEFKGKYDLTVKVSGAKSYGDVVGTADNYKARVRLHGKKHKGQDGKTYVHYDKVQIKIQPGRSKLELKNLFDDNPTLQLIASAIVSENSNNFVNDIIPTLEKSLSETFTKAANDIVKTASFDEMFPDI